MPTADPRPPQGVPLWQSQDRRAISHLPYVLSRIRGVLQRAGDTPVESSTSRNRQVKRDLKRPPMPDSAYNWSRPSVFAALQCREQIPLLSFIVPRRSRPAFWD